MTAPQTTGGAIRAYINTALPTLNVYRAVAPAGQGTPMAIIHDGLVVTTRDIGDSAWLLNELVQLDLYQPLNGDRGLPDSLHRLLHKVAIPIDGAQVFLCRVQQRITNAADESDDDNIVRTTFTLSITRTNH